MPKLSRSGRHTAIDLLGATVSLLLSSALHNRQPGRLLSGINVNTGLDVLDRILRGPQFFNTALHPRIRFVSDSIRYADGKPVEATGQLTLLGVSRPVTLEIRDFSCTTHFLRRIPLCGADVHVTIRRSEFGMTFGLPNLVGDEVKLAIQVEGLRD